MATAVKAIGDFAGTETENVEEWIRTINVMSKLAELNDRENVKVAVF
jgi:hypothetical protein